MMSARNRSLVVLPVLMAALLMSRGYVQAKEVEKDYLQRMLELVVEANPTLQSQRNLITEIEIVPEPVRGPDLALALKTGAEIATLDGSWERRVEPTGSIELTIPLYSAVKKRKIALDRLIIQKDLAKAWQDYYRLKNSVTSDLLTRVDKIISLKNELDAQKKLLLLLERNLAALAKQVEAGVAKSSDLWAISERIMIHETKIRNLSSTQETLRRETAVNLAGARWPELLKMLEFEAP